MWSVTRFMCEASQSLVRNVGFMWVRNVGSVRTYVCMYICTFVRMYVDCPSENCWVQFMWVGIGVMWVGFMWVWVQFMWVELGFVWVGVQGSCELGFMWVGVRVSWGYHVSWSSGFMWVGVRVSWDSCDMWVGIRGSCELEFRVRVSWGSCELGFVWVTYVHTYPSIPWASLFQATYVRRYVCTWWCILQLLSSHCQVFRVNYILVQLGEGIPE